MTTYHKITPENPPQFPCWGFLPENGRRKDSGWHRLQGDAMYPEYYRQFTHWCHSPTRPTAAPDAANTAPIHRSAPTPEQVAEEICAASDQQAQSLAAVERIEAILTRWREAIIAEGKR